MSGPARHTAHHRQHPLTAGWAMCRVPAGAIDSPAGLSAATNLAWLPIEPGTVAHALRSRGEWSLDARACRFDADDWWYRLRFDMGAAPADEFTDLVFDGLATLSEVWLNGRPVLSSQNMHLSHELRGLPWRAGGNELLIQFRSLDAWLAARRKRPRWRAPMVDHQQLRWARTTLLGRTPGWSPSAAPVGLWRGVRLQHRQGIDATNIHVTSHLDGTRGVLGVRCELRALQPASPIAEAWLEVKRDGTTLRTAMTRHGAADAWAATLDVENAALWWPHTHGEPALYAARMVVTLRGTDAPVVVDLGARGFRTVAVDRDAGDFAVHINGVPVFCRGACWTPLDVVSLTGTADAYRHAIGQVREAGMNMLRVSGSMVCENDAFHDECDAQGVMVWQDFMFANMDYPHDDPAFAASVREEAAQHLARWQARPSVVVLCGNSECEQQAAMWGSPREAWASPWFDHELAELARAACPDVPYWPSSAHGGAFPHQNNVGTTSYYGVGAYLRPLDDARRANLRFATECLAFANVPPASTLERMPGGESLRVHHPLWKARAPRDLGAGWDFDDVRDHYLEQLYRIDARALRRTDHERYLMLGRAVSTEVMAAAFAEWRRGTSSCRGALVWFLRDLWPGAGWGVLDDAGVPKAAFHGLKRVLAPRAVFISDEGTNGLEVHVVNEAAQALDAHIDVALYRDDDLLLAQATQPHRVASRGTFAAPLADWFDAFIDLSNAYRFGPAQQAMVVVTLRDAEGASIGQAFHFTEGLPNRREREIGLTARARMDADGVGHVTVSAPRFAQSVHFEVPGFVAQDEFFHLAPGQSREVRMVREASNTAQPMRGHVIALNAWAAAPIQGEA